MQNQAMTGINKNRSELANLQNQASTLKRITKPSDDPTGMAKVLSNKTENKNFEQYDKNIFYAKTFLETTENTLSQLGEAIVRAKELAVQAANDTNQGLPRETIGLEIQQIYNSVLEMGNRRFGERYVFGGYRTTESPFDLNGSYSGDNGQIKVQNLHGQFMPINLTGSQVFLGEDFKNFSILNRDAQVPKTVEELRELKFEQESKELQKKLKAQNDLENQKENDNDNDNDDVSDEMSALELRKPANLGGVQRIDRPDPQSQGINIFTTLSGLESALRTNDKSGIQTSLDALDQAFNQVNLARAEVGGRMNVLAATSDGIQRSIVDNKTYNSQIEDADLFQVMTDLNKSNQTLEGTLKTSSQFMHQSLLDFLR